MKKLSLLIMFLIGCISTTIFAQINVDDEAPDFVLTSLENEQIALSDLQGSVVYIFFFGANCPHCRSNGPITEDEIYQSFKDNDKFVALGLDTWNTSAAEVTNFKNVTGITYPLLLNAQSSLVDYYGSPSAYDRSVVIASNGTIAYKGTSFVNNDYQQVNESIEAELSIATSNEDNDFELPTLTRLKQNFPNPFNPSTTISYTLTESAEVSIAIYNMLGVKVASIENGFRSSGEYSITFDASSFSSGIYIYQLTTDQTSLTKRMTLLK